MIGTTFNLLHENNYGLHTVKIPHKKPTILKYIVCYRMDLRDAVYTRTDSPVRYAKFESIRYFIDIDILQNCLIDIDIDIDIFQNHHIDIDIDIDIFGIALSISISISIFFRIALSISISISIFSTSPYRYRYRYRYFSKVSIYRQSICHIDISNRAKCCSKVKDLKLIFSFCRFACLQ